MKTGFRGLGEWMVRVPYTLVLVLLGGLAWARPQFEGDTVVLIGWARNALECLQAGRYQCDVGHFPLMQYLPALGILRLGGSDQVVLRGLVWLSFASFLGVLWLMRSVLSNTGVRPVGEVLILTSPLLLYSSSSFGEMGAAFWTLAFTAALLSGASWWVLAALSLAVAMTKEIAAPFLVLLGVVAFVIAPAGRKRRHIAIGTAAGVAAGLMTATAFNLFRFGVPYNVALLAEELRTPSSEQPGYFFGLWLAPNGGVAFYWSTFVALLAAVSAGVARALLRRERPMRWGIPALGVWILLGGLTLGLSRWFQPFGWFAWGPRLLLPWLPSAAAVLLFCYADVLGRQIAWIRARPVALVAAALVLVAVSVPQFAVLFQPGPFISFAYLPDAVCPRIPIIQEDASFFYRCMDQWIWRPARPILPATWVELVKHPWWTAAAVAWLAVLGERLASVGSARGRTR